MSSKDSDNPAKVGLLFLGRKRPGFDMEWGAGMEMKARQAVRQSSFAVFEPSQKAVDEASLRQVVAECKAAGVQALLLLQTTMADGRLALTLAQEWPYPPLFWGDAGKTGRRHDQFLLFGGSPSLGIDVPANGQIL